jgi:hypothetical protein
VGNVNNQNLQQLATFVDYEKIVELSKKISLNIFNYVSLSQD